MGKNISTYRHIGYYNDYSDIKELYADSPDDIVNMMKNGFGSFHECEGERDTDIDEIETGLDMGLTHDKEYIVKYQRGDDNEGWCIDIYQHHTLEVVEGNNKEGIYEYCPHCDTEVTLMDEFKVQSCPNCGKKIVPCNLCPLLGENKCTGNCPLEALANELNEDKKKYGVEYSIGSFVSEFNSSREKQWEKGFLLTIFNDDGFIDIVLRIFYIKSLDTICFMNERDSDKGWFMREPKRLSIDYLEQVFEVLDISSNYKLYVKVLD